MIHQVVVLFLCVFFAQATLFADPFDVSSYIAFDARAYTSSPQFVDQDSDSIDGALLFDTDVSFGGDDFHINWHPFVRLDFVDTNRTHFDLREFNIIASGDNWDLLFGVETVFWGVTESRHLVNIINQNDQLEDIDEEDKLGQPMVNLSFQGESSFLELYYLPVSREREQPGNSSRFRGPFSFADDEYESPAEEFHQDFAVRVGDSIGGVDLAFSYFRGTNREPILSVRSQEGEESVITPFYEIIDQFGFEGQYTHEALLLKAEAIYREGRDEGFFAAVGGFEYSLFEILDTSMDIGILAEYLYDGRDSVISSPTFFDNDIFSGIRLSLNDSQDTSLLSGAIIDIETSEALYFLEFSRRLTDNYRLEIESRWFVNTDNESPLAFIESDDFINFRLSRYF